MRAQISVALDGELSQLERAMLSSHLARCADCRAYEADVTAFTHALREVPPESLSRPIVVSARRRFVMNRLQVGAAAALAVAALFGTGELLRSKQLEIQPVYVPVGKTELKYPTQRQFEREQAILERARPGNPVQIRGRVL